MSILDSSTIDRVISPRDVQAEPLARSSSELARGLALSAIYGLALGARFGPASMATHAAGVPLCFLAVGCLATPAFYIGLAHAGVTLSPQALGRATARGTSTAGRALAGLAPATLLLGVTSESVHGAIIFGAIGLAVGFCLALRTILGELDVLVGKTRFRSGLSLAFVLFAQLLAVRVCWLVLPLFGGGS